MGTLDDCVGYLQRRYGNTDPPIEISYSPKDSTVYVLRRPIDGSPQDAAAALPFASIHLKPEGGYRLTVFSLLPDTSMSDRSFRPSAKVYASDAPTLDGLGTLIDTAFERFGGTGSSNPDL